MIKWSGRTSAYEHKRGDWEKKDISNVVGGLRKIWFLDAQWSTCPIEVESQVEDLWRLHELGNDQYILKTSVNDLLEYGDNTLVERWINPEPGRNFQAGVNGWVEQPLKVDAIIQYIREHNIPDDEAVIIHWWW